PPGGRAQLAGARGLAGGASGRTAMTELRHLLGLLAPAGEASAAEETGVPGPQPGLDQVPALIDRVRAAGLNAELSVCGAPRPLPPRLDLGAYPVLHEALTNRDQPPGPA